MQYPCVMWTIRDGEPFPMRFKENAPVEKPGWFMTKEAAEALLVKPKGQAIAQDEPEEQKPKRRGWPKGKPRK